MNLFDLRFVIGIFFLVLGLLLTIYGLVVYGQAHAMLNIICGLLFILFALIMILLSRRKPSNPGVEDASS